MSVQIKGYCKECGGIFEFERCDRQRIYLRCRHCDFGMYYEFRDEEEALRFAEEENEELLSRLRRGVKDWELTQWDRLHDDVVEFINTHPYVETDIRFQMAKIACITRGFHMMDEDIYQRCHGRFNVAESIYRTLLENAKQQALDPSRSASMADYKQARAYYLYLQGEYVALKMAKKAATIIVKKLAKPMIPF